MKSVRFSWILTYMLFLILPLITSSVIFFRNEKQIVRQTIEANHIFLETAVSQSNFWIKEAQTLSMRLLKDTEIKELLTEPAAANNYYKRYTVRQTLSNYITPENQIGSITVFNPANGLVLTNETIATIETYFDALQREGYRGDYNQLTEWFMGERYNQCVAVPFKDGYQLFYIYADITGAGPESRTYIAVSMNDSAVRQKLANMIEPADDVAFADDNGTVLFSVNDKVRKLSIPPETKLLEQPVETEINGVTYLTFFMDTKMGDWKAIYFAESKGFYQNSRVFRLSITASMIVCLLVGILIIIYQVRKNYRPISEIIDILGKQPKGSGKNIEYTVIKETIQSALDDLKTMRYEVDKREKLVRTNILTRLIKNDTGRGYRYPAKEVLEANGLLFKPTKFCIVVFCVEDVTHLFEEEQISEQDKLDSVLFILENVFSELCEKIGTVYAVEMERRLVCIVNAKSVKNEDFAKRLYDIGEETMDMILQHFDFKYTMLIGGACDGLEGINTSYKQAMTAFDYRIVRGTGGIISYSDICNMDSEQIYDYPIGDETMLLNSIIAGKEEQATELVKAILERNLYKRSNSARNIKLLIVDIAATLHKIVKTIKFEDKAEREALCREIDGIYDTDFAEDIEAKITAVIANICGIIRQQSNEDTDGLVNNIILYVRQNYGDKELSVETLAKRFYISANYLSYVFKAVTGDGLLNYINRLRVEEAKRIMLEDVDINIERVTEMVGYMNRSTFSRVFVKYVGLSPQKWRDAERKRNTKEK